MEKHYFLQSGKRVQQTLQIPLPPAWVNYFSQNSSSFSLNIHINLNGNPEHQKVSFSIEERNVTIGNRVQQTIVLDSTN